MKKILLIALTAIALCLAGSVTRTITSDSDNVETLVRNSNGNYFEATEAGIQAALDDIDKPKSGQGYYGGTVWVPGGKSISIHNGLILANYSTLDLGGSTLLLRENVNAVTMAYGSTLRNGVINTRIPGTFTEAAVLFDGTHDYWLQTRIENLELYSENQEGIGIHYEAQENGEVMAFTLCNNIQTYRFENALKLECTGGQPGVISYINGNIFTNFVSMYDTYTVYIERNTEQGNNEAGVDGNIFHNFMIQPGAETQSCIVADGRYNQFTNIFLWDWYAAGGNTSYHLTNDSSETYIHFFGGGQDLLDEGTDNTILDTGNSDMKISGYLTTENEIKGKIYSRTTEPNIEDNSFAFWHDSNNDKYYIVLDSDGTQRKTELT